MLIYSLPENLRFTKKYHSGWGILMETLTENRLKAADLRNVLGLTYRQINDWDSRGILQTYRIKSHEDKATGWRKFSISDLIPLSILVNLKKLGIPVSRLKKVVETLFLTEADLYHFFPNIVYGLSTYFLTDLESMTGYDCMPDDRKSLSIHSYNFTRSQVLMVLQLNSIIYNVFEKLELTDFIPRFTENDKIEFTINGVPLALEPLDKNPTAEEQAEFFKELKSERKGK